MKHFEDLGFSVMASYDAKLTVAEVITIGIGGALSYAAAYFASQSLAESDDASRKASLLKKAIDFALEKNFDPFQIEILEPVRARMLGMEIEPEEVPRLIPLLQKISENRTKTDLENVGLFIEDANDLEMLAKIGRMSLPEREYVSVAGQNDASSSANGFKQLKEKKDWEQYAKDVEDFQNVPDLYKKLFWKPEVLDMWRNSLQSEEMMNAISAAKAAVNATNDSKWMTSALQQMFLDTYTHRGGDPLFEEVDRDDLGVEYQNDWWVEPLKELAESGMLKKFDEAEIQDNLSSNEAEWQKKWRYLRRLKLYLKFIDNVGQWDEYDELVRKTEKLFEWERESPFHKVIPHVPLDVIRRRRAEHKKVNATRRARDRLAQRDPDWAISEFPREYEKGKRVAWFLKEIADGVEGMLKKGETVVVHGRDGELLYDLLMRRPGVDKSKVRYAITSRPVTTWTDLDHVEGRPLHEAHRQELQRYYDYVSRVVPVGAIHVDTGFEGSVPGWFDEKGFEVKSIRMMSASGSKAEIPIDTPLTPQERRKIVIEDIENSAKRLERLTRYRVRSGIGGFSGIRYSENAPGYHARAYGVYDELGLPRLKTKVGEKARKK